MELLKKNIHLYRQTKRAVRQTTLEEDINVPDTKQDVGMIIQNKERVVIEQTRTESGQVIFEGYLELAVLYIADTAEKQVQHLETKVRFQEFAAVDGVEPGDAVWVKCEVEDLAVTLINSRKLSMRGILTFQTGADEIYDMAVAVGQQSGLEVCEKTKSLELMQLEIQKKDILRIKEEMTVNSNKPNIQELLWQNVQLRNSEVRVLDGNLQVSGELFVFLLYTGDDENGTTQWMEAVLPVKGQVDCQGALSTMVPDIGVSLSQLELTARPDADGEERLIHLEGMLDLDIKLYRNENVMILEDLFSPEKELIPTAAEESYESLVMRNASRCRAAGKIKKAGNRPRILQVCHSSGTVKVDELTITEKGVRVEGALLLSILYISADDTQPFALMEGSLPFSHLAEVPGIDKACRCSLDAGIEQLSTTMADSEEIEVKAAISLKLFVVKENSQRCISAVEEAAVDEKKLASLPGIVGYLVQPGDTLWDIAREYYTTPERLMRLNQLETESLRPGDCLLVVKTVAQAGK